MPIFSIIVPTYNRVHFIQKTLESILSQDFIDFEIIVVDDGSRDDTDKIVGKFTDKRIQYFKKENGERGVARNYGTQKAKGLYMNFFDSDDLMYPNHLSTAYALITSLSKPEIIHLGYDYKFGDGRIITKVNTFDDTIQNVIKFDNKLSCNGVFLRNDIAKTFPFEESRKLASSEDWELWLRLISRFKLHYCNEITSSVINHDQRSLHTISADKVVERDLFLIEKLKQDPVVMVNFGKSFNKFTADRYTFFMLSFAEQRQQAEVWSWGIKAFRVYPLILLNKRFLASLKNITLK